MKKYKVSKITFNHNYEEILDKVEYTVPTLEKALEVVDIEEKIINRDMHITHACFDLFDEDSPLCSNFGVLENGEHMYISIFIFES